MTLQFSITALAIIVGIFSSCPYEASAASVGMFTSYV